MLEHEQQELERRDRHLRRSYCAEIWFGRLHAGAASGKQGCFQTVSPDLALAQDAVSPGEEILIGDAGGAGRAARLLHQRRVAARREPGALKGRIKIHDDFDDLPPDLAAVFGVAP